MTDETKPSLTNNLNLKAWRNLSDSYPYIVDFNKVKQRGLDMGKSEKYITSKIRKCHETYDACVDSSPGEINTEKIGELMVRIQEFANGNYLNHVYEADHSLIQEFMHGLSKFVNDVKENKFTRENILEATKDYSEYFDYPVVEIFKKTSEGYAPDKDCDNIGLIVDDGAKIKGCKHYVEVETTQKYATIIEKENGRSEFEVNQEARKLSINDWRITDEGYYRQETVESIPKEKQLSLKDYLIENYPLLAKETMDKIQKNIEEKQQRFNKSLSGIEKKLNTLESTTLTLEDFKNLKPWQHNEFDENYALLTRELKEYRKNRLEEFKKSGKPFIEIEFSENGDVYYIGEKYSGGIGTVEEIQNAIEQADLIKVQHEKENDLFDPHHNKNIDDYPYPNDIGYDKTKFIVHNVPNTQKIPIIEGDESYSRINSTHHEEEIEKYAKENNLTLTIPETIDISPDRYDIGDGNGNIFNFMRENPQSVKLNKTLDDLENTLYHSNVSEYARNTIHSIFENHIEQLKAPLTEVRNISVEKFIEKYKATKGFIVDFASVKKAENEYEKALQNTKQVYEKEIYSLMKSFAKSNLVNDKNLVDFFKKEMRNFICDIQNPFSGAKIEYPDVSYENANPWELWRNEKALLPSTAELPEFINEKMEALLKEKEVVVEQKTETQEEKAPIVDFEKERLIRENASLKESNLLLENEIKQLKQQLEEEKLSHSLEKPEIAPKIKLDNEEYNKVLENVQKQLELDTDLKDINTVLDSHVEKKLNCSCKSVIVDERFFNKYELLLDIYSKISVISPEDTKVNIIEPNNEKPKVLFSQYDWQKYQFNNMAEAEVACIASESLFTRGEFETFLEKVCSIDEKKLHEISAEIQAGFNIKKETDFQKLFFMVEKYQNTETKVTPENFPLLLKAALEIDKRYGGNSSITELSGSIISFATDKEKPVLAKWLQDKGCKDEKTTTEVLTKLVESKITPNQSIIPSRS